MGTLNFTLGTYGRDEARTLISSRPLTSDSYTTSTSASNVEDGSGDITAGERQVFRATINEAAWIAFGGRTATVGGDFYMRPDVEYEWEIAAGDAGTISVIDVA